MQSIGKLPLELLARIFAIGDDMQREVRLSGQPYKGFQDLVTQVCRNWRDVAISTPTLWTYIYVSKPPPHRHAELYISRSGGCPLIIDLDMRTSYTRAILDFELHGAAKQAIETLTFLVESGATLDRWGGLIVFSKKPQVMFDIVQFVDSGPPTALRLLSLKWKTYTGQGWSVEWDRLLLLARSLRGDHLYSGLRAPQLRHVELYGLPPTFIFNPTSPMVSNLTYLKFASSEILPTLQVIRALLSANTRLNSLFIDMSAVPWQDDRSEAKSLNPALVTLPLLRTFSLNIVPVPKWGLQLLLQIIDAPQLESFELSVGALDPEDTVLQELFLYLSNTGRTNGAVRRLTSLEQKSTHDGSIFPSLRYLNIENVFSDLLVVRALLDAFPTVIQITLELDGLAILSHFPQLLPNVSHFTYNNADTHSLDLILLFVSQRVNTGMSISTLEINTTIPGLVPGALNGEGSDLYETYIAPLRQYVDEVKLRLYEREDSEPSDLSDDEW